MIVFCKYCLVGVINTAIGYGIVALLIWLKIIPELANFIGYIIGISISYFLNHHFTFSQSQTYDSHIKRFLRFAGLMMIAFLMNLIALFLCYRVFCFNIYLSQALATGVYAIVGFVLNKKITWAK